MPKFYKKKGSGTSNKRDNKPESETTSVEDKVSLINMYL